MTSIRVSLCRNGSLEQGDQRLIDTWRADSDDKLWVDIQDPTEEVLEPLLEKRFGFHELASEDSLSPNTLPKYDAFPNYDFFVFRAVDPQKQFTKLAAFLGRNFLFTIHREALAPIDDVCNRLPGDVRLLANGPDFMLYSIVDEMVDAHFPLLVSIEDHVDDLQERIFKDAQPAHLDELLHLKREVNLLRRQSLPQRELMNQISRGDAQFVQKQFLIYFRDIYDHMFRISETIDVERDMMSGTMEAYLSVIANRTNEIMKTLTVFASIMLPLTLIAGIYGMNFTNMPELHWQLGYPYALGLMAAVTIVMLIWFRRKGWIGNARR
ncbi:MAG TPA: magnesium/cobalt transporter CorA [Thermoanaerobaculia bacterium]|nr:magnesium/cobalt transporter CorA [Thermoanaerobaculia bacterium]